MNLSSRFRGCFKYDYKTIKFLPPSTAEYLDCRVAYVYNFQKFRPDRKIRLITSHHSPLELILKFYSGTCVISYVSSMPVVCVMNQISHEKVYPRGTFKERRSMICRREDLSVKKLQQLHETNVLHVNGSWSRQSH